MLREISLWLLCLFKLAQYSSAQEPVSERSTYVTTRCYGDSFNLDCGQGHQIHITRDVYGYTASDRCDARDVSRACVPAQGAPVVSIAQQLCTGRQTCAHVQVERRSCGSVYSNLQQLHYQCIPGTKLSPYLFFVKLHCQPLKTIFILGRVTSSSQLCPVLTVCWIVAM